ncbi:putative short-chain dehydrogenase reductase protein [Colletotrichum sp. SAR 10_65]|nr:putative short-chain dehydrogenase reductase protein [Colletotrichum sp. SAR 10_65]KAI8250582.1 putative short-chain dehydrogenase reductase protein [Colletotrichum sp. SAR11_239]
MASTIKTIVATGATSGLGFEAIKQLLAQTQPYKFILGGRNTSAAKEAYDGLHFDSSRHSLKVVPLELSNLKTVRSFAQETLDSLGQDKLDYLFLNAAQNKGAEAKGPFGSNWCESYIVNHLSQHYLLHLLRDKLVESQSRIIFVSSGAVRNVPDISVLDKDLLGGAGTKDTTIYCETKFVQLLNAHWWRRQLKGSATVLAVSPGLIPGTGLGRHSSFKLTMDMPDAKSVSEGASNLLRAFTISNFPPDDAQIFLTSWGEWWSKDIYANTLDEQLQAKWSPSIEEIESEEGLA